MKTKLGTKITKIVAGFACSTVLVAATACGSSTGEAAEPVKHDWASIEELEAAAQEEGGTLDLYMNGDYVPILAEGFKQAYPWVTVNSTNLDSGQAAEKWTAELDADLGVVDVLVLRLDSYKPFVDRGAVAQITVPNGADLPESTRDEGGYTWAVNNLILALLYNSALTDGGPADLSELSDPQWKDKLVMPNPAEGGAAALMFAAMRSEMGEEAWRSWLEGIQANNPILTGSSSEAYAAALRGDRPLCICSYGDYVSQDPGAPIASDFYNQESTGMIFNPNLAVVAANAPHPATAALFINWAISPDGGQQAFVESGRAPAVSTADIPGAENVGLPADVRGAEIFTVMADYIADPESFLTVYQEVFA